METKEQVKLVFIADKSTIYLEFPKVDDKLYTVWQCSMGHSFKTIKECFDFMSKEFESFKLKGLDVSHEINFSL